MPEPFIIYLKNKNSSLFELKKDVSNIVPLSNSYRITFKNGKTYNYGNDKVLFYPFISTQENVYIYENGKLNKRFNTVDNYGNYFIFRGNGFCSSPIENNSNIEIYKIKPDIKQAQAVMGYFKEILTQSGGISLDIKTDEIDDNNPNKISSEILIKALNKIDVLEPRSVLSNYLDGTKPLRRTSKKPYIYPFGCNESQKLAIETSLSNSINIIEGPPGTGKTQTILNIIANLIIQNKSVAIVSNNNSAVFNIREKLQRYGYGMIVASLGNKENKQSFFDKQEEQILSQNFELQNSEIKEAKNKLNNLDNILTKSFKFRNKLALLKTKLADIEIEYNHIKLEQPLSLHIKSYLDKNFHCKWSSNKSLKLKDFLSNIDPRKKLSVKDKFRFLLKYRFFKFNDINKYNEELNVYVNHKFYDLYITSIREEIATIEHWLDSNNETDNLRIFVEKSKDIFNNMLYKKYQNIKIEAFTSDDYRNRFDNFVKHYPVILSSTLSLTTSIPEGFLFDYLIIDESSQVDIIKSSVCFSCCRNAVIVGDSMQLNHIVAKDTMMIAEQLLKSYRIAPAYNYVEQNILTSLRCLYGDSINSILLKEHYRCHPTIIGFCNKKYYNNNLVIMTNGNNEPFKIIETNISGERNFANQRQIDETELYIKDNYSENYTNVGVIAPYRHHANILKEKLPIGTESDTIHKYQGREKDSIIFNTVSNKIDEFIDNPNLINVAVSRAVKEFIIVKPKSMKLPHGTNIGDLIRYINYTTDAKNIIVESKIRSVFDLLYKEYHSELNTFLDSNSDMEGSAAEVLIHKLLLDKILLPNSSYSFIDIAREYKLRDLVHDYDLLSEDEVYFIQNNSRLDFLLYNKIDKAPILAIEVDGVSFHEDKSQKDRDNKKTHILEVIGLPLLRLSTNGYDEEMKIIDKLNASMNLN